MNSLNMLSARVSPPPSPTTSRSSSFGNILSAGKGAGSRRGSREGISHEEKDQINELPGLEYELEEAHQENTPLLEKESGAQRNRSAGWDIIAGISTRFLNSIRWVLSTLSAPGVYLLSCLYDERGKFAPLSQIRKVFSRGPRRGSTVGVGISSMESSHLLGNHKNEKIPGIRRSSLRKSRSLASNSSSSGLSSESESELATAQGGSITASSSRHARSKSSDEISPTRRSIRIKLHSDDTLRQRKHRKTQSTTQSNGAGAISASEVTAANLKSPTSPVSSLSLTKYPRAPAPPRPLIPRRQPSYSHPDSAALPQKTLILDLDETLIHSMGGQTSSRMGAGHMIEVKLPTWIGADGNSPGPQHPVLYFVHKRPHCDEFLRRVSKWYNLVAFTASVQEYADPVIDYLEQDRPYFSGRLYRQNCTYRGNQFVKDLSSVEPDLSKVMILDNSPGSYTFHTDNAIPIEGWINDPTDNDLLHLLPLLEALQYVTDVRAFLGLQHMTSNSSGSASNASNSPVLSSNGGL